VLQQRPVASYWVIGFVVNITQVCLSRLRVMSFRPARLLLLLLAAGQVRVDDHVPRLSGLSRETDTDAAGGRCSQTPSAILCAVQQSSGLACRISRRGQRSPGPTIARPGPMIRSAIRFHQCYSTGGSCLVRVTATESKS